MEKGKTKHQEEEEEDIATNHPKKVAKASDDDEEQTVRGKKPAKKKKQEEEEEEDEDQATIRKKKPVKKEMSKAKEGSDEEEKQETKQTLPGDMVLTLSGAMKKKNDQQSNDIMLIQGCRILSQEIKEQFKDFFSQDYFMSWATQNQVVHLKEKKTEIDFTNSHSIIQYMAENGYNYNEVYSLEFLAKGGESYVLRGDLKQPVEVVIKTVLPENVTQDTFTSIITESHLIKLLQEKEHVVNIYEEIIEVDQSNNNILNYLVVVEQAIQDLKNIINIWSSYEKSHEYMEFFSNHKLYYFIFKAAQAMQYLHNRNIYYGDLKEQNLLVFRDYSVKLGDFGVSIKMNEHEDPNEETYEMKGATQGYTLDKYYRSLQEGDGQMFSKNQLIANDYHTLVQTFRKVQDVCQTTFSKEAVEARAQQKQLKFFQNSYDHNSYFCQFLEDLRTLHPEKKPLNEVIRKYLLQVEQDDEFFFEFCEQLITDEKYQAIPNVLRLWKHRFIIQKMLFQFDKEEKIEFPFLNPKQKTQIQEDINIGSDMELNVSQEQLIGIIKGYIKKDIKDVNKELIPFIPYITRYKGYLLESVYNQFYREAFGGYFQMEIESETQNLYQLYLKDPGQIGSHLSGLEFKTTHPCTSIKDLDMFKLENTGFEILSQFLLFIGVTTDKQDELKSMVASYLQIMKDNFTNFQLLEEQLRILQNPNRTLLWNWKQFYQLNLILNQHKLVRGQKPNDYFNCSHYFNERYYMFTNQGELLKQLSELSSSQDSSQQTKKVYQWLMKQLVLSEWDNTFHKASLHSDVLSYLTQIQDDFIMDPVELRKNMTNSRQLMKRTYGELGNQMSKNAYEIYKLTQKLLSMKNIKKEWVAEALVLLIKACNFSNREQKFQFLLDLIEEYNNQGRIEDRDEVIASSKELSELFYAIARHHYCNEEVDPAKKRELWQELQLPRSRSIFKSISLNQEAFIPMLVKFYGNENLLFANFEFLTKEIFMSETLPGLITHLNTINDRDSRWEENGNSYKFSQSKEQQNIQITYQDKCELNLRLKEGIPSGPLNYKISEKESFQERLIDGKYDGSVEYRVKKLKITGERFGDDLKGIKVKRGDFVIKTTLGPNFSIAGFGMEYSRDSLYRMGIFKKDTFTGRQFVTYDEGLSFSEVIKDARNGPRVRFTYDNLYVEDCFMGIDLQTNFVYNAGTNRLSMTLSMDPEKDKVYQFFENGKLYENLTRMYQKDRNYKMDQGEYMRCFEDGVVQKNCILFGRQADDLTVFYHSKNVAQKGAKIKENYEILGRVWTYDEYGVLLGVSDESDRNTVGSFFDFDDQTKLKVQQILASNGNVLEERVFFNGEYLYSTTYRTPDQKSYTNLSCTYSRNGLVLFKETQNYINTIYDQYESAYFDLQGNEIGQKSCLLQEKTPQYYYYDNGKIRKSIENDYSSTPLITYYYKNGQKAWQGSASSPEEFSDFCDQEGNIIIKASPHTKISMDDNGQLVSAQSEEFHRHYFSSGKLMWEKDLKTLAQSWFSECGRYKTVRFEKEGQKDLKENQKDFSYEYYEDEVKVGSQTSKESGRNGKVLTFLQDTKEDYMAQYQAEKKQGGPLVMIEEYKDDQLQKQFMFYHSGRIFREASYKDWILDGQEKMYYPSGAVYKVAHYKDGEPEGQVDFLSQQGRKDAELWFHEGQLQYIAVDSYHLDGLKGLKPEHGH